MVERGLPDVAPDAVSVGAVREKQRRGQLCDRGAQVFAGRTKLRELRGNWSLAPTPKVLRVEAVPVRVDADEGLQGRVLVRRRTDLRGAAGAAGRKAPPEREVRHQVTQAPARALAGEHLALEVRIAESSEPRVQVAPRAFQQRDRLVLRGCRHLRTLSASQAYACGYMPTKHARSVMSSFTWTAGLPAHTVRGASLRVRTTLPAPMSTSSPISTPGRIVLFAPRRARRQTVAPFTH